MPSDSEVPKIDEAAALDAFAVARAQLAPPVEPGAAAPAFVRPVRDERRDNRWRTRNARRVKQGKVPFTDAEQLEQDRAAGLAPAAPAAPPIPGAAAPPVDGAPVPRAPGKLTRVELEQELAQLRALAATRFDADLENAIGSTAGVVWDTVRKFTPRADRALDVREKSELGRLWAPILGPRLEAVAYAVPWVAAVAATYEIFAPRVAGAIIDSDEAPVIVAQREADATRGNETREVKPAVERVVAPTVEAAEGSSGLVDALPLAGPMEAAPGGYTFEPGVSE
jgi:hypothetical protein